MSISNNPESLPWEQEPDHIADVSKKADSPPWFKDLTQLKRFVNLRSGRSFVEKSAPDPEFEKAKEIFK